MPFPQVNRAPVRPEYAPVVNERQAADVMQAVNRLAAHFKVKDAVPVKAAAVVYLGLCRLKEYSEQGDSTAGRDRCMKLLNDLAAPNGGGIVLNCSFFKKERKLGEPVDHEDAIKRACEVYLPLTKSRKKRCLMLMALGAEHDTGTALPDDDTWLNTFEFHRNGH